MAEARLTADDIELIRAELAKPVTKVYTVLARRLLSELDAVTKERDEARAELEDTHGPR